MASASDTPVVGLEASVMASSPNKPVESAVTGPQKPGRGKPSSQDAPRTVGQEPKLPESLFKDDVILSSTAVLKEPRIGAGERTITEAADSSIVISISNTDTNAVASAAPVTQKLPKIGSGRLSQAEVGSGRKPRGKRGKGHSVRTTAAEEPVTIGIAVIRTPSDQPDLQHKAVDEMPKLKGILKSSPREWHENWVEEPVEKLNWDKEIEEAQRRKAEMSDGGLEGITVTIENRLAGNSGAVKSSAMFDESVADGDDDDDDQWEDVDDDEEALDEDILDISAESFDQFIKEHTLKLDVELAAPDITEWTSKDPSGSITAGSDDSFLKTPVGQSRVIDWGSEMDQLSQTEKHHTPLELGKYYCCTFVTAVAETNLPQYEHL